MNFHSILHRELLLAAKKPTTYWMRMALASIAVIAAFGMAQAAFLGLTLIAATGRNLLIFLAALGLLWALFEGLLLTIDSVSREQREGTLGLLFLSNLNGYDIIIGKAAGAGLRTFCGLLAAAPAPALTFLMGGVTFTDYAFLIAALLNALLFALALGLFTSTVLRTRKATNAAGAALLAWFVFGAPAAGAFLHAHGWPLISSFVSISPATPLLLVIDGGWPNYLIYLALALSNFTALALLGSAGFRLNRFWRGEAVVRESRVEPVRTRTMRRVNPIFAATNKRVARLGGFWVVCAMSLPAILAIWIWAPRASQLPLFATLLALLHFALSFEVTAMSTRALAEDIRSGLLELLLTTPLPEQEISTGYLLAIKARVARAYLFLLFLGAGLITLAYFRMNNLDFIGVPGAYVGLITLHLGELWFNARVGLWKGLQAANSASAFRRTTGLTVMAGILSTLAAGLCALTVFPWTQILAPGVFLVAGAVSLTAILTGIFAHATSNLNDRVRLTASRAG